MRRSAAGGVFWAVALSLLTPEGCGQSDVAGAPSSCATGAVPDMTLTSGFTVDTGMTGGVGAVYGQAECSGEYLVEVDLTSSALQGHDFFTDGRWSVTLPAEPCDEYALLTTFVSDGTSWRVWDVVPYAPVPENPGCHAQAQSHLDPGSAQLGGTNIPAADGFERARMAVRAWSGSAPVPVEVSGETNP